MQEGAYITAIVFGEKRVGFYHSKPVPSIHIPEVGTFSVDPDTIRYLGEPE